MSKTAHGVVKAMTHKHYGLWGNILSILVACASCIIGGIILYVSLFGHHILHNIQRDIYAKTQHHIIFTKGASLSWQGLSLYAQVNDVLVVPDHAQYNITVDNYNPPTSINKKHAIMMADNVKVSVPLLSLLWGHNADNTHKSMDIAVNKLHFTSSMQALIKNIASQFPKQALHQPVPAPPIIYSATPSYGHITNANNTSLFINNAHADSALHNDNEQPQIDAAAIYNILERMHPMIKEATARHIYITINQLSYADIILGRVNGHYSDATNSEESQFNATIIPDIQASPSSRITIAWYRDTHQHHYMVATLNDALLTNAKFLLPSWPFLSDMALYGQLALHITPNRSYDGSVAIGSNTIMIPYDSVLNAIEAPKILTSVLNVSDNLQACVAINADITDSVLHIKGHKSIMRTSLGSIAIDGILAPIEERLDMIYTIKSPYIEATVTMDGTFHNPNIALESSKNAHILVMDALFNIAQAQKLLLLPPHACLK